MLFKKNSNKIIEETPQEKTVLKIKTVDDIPVIKEMRRKIGNNERREAVLYGYTNLKSDYARYFGSPLYGSNREFILGEMANFNVKPENEESLTDNIAIRAIIVESRYPENRENEGKESKLKDREHTRFFAIKKIALFYFNYYEIARFGNYNWETLEEKEIIDPVKDIYNYMDLMKLFYNGDSGGN